MSLSSILSTVQTEMNRYLCPILLIFGITGCLLNILLFSQRQFRNISCCTCKYFSNKISEGSIMNNVYEG
jgi:hypothetical protein